MTNLKIIFLSVFAVTLLSITSVFATEHYEITTSSSIANETYSDYSQSSGNGGVFYIGNNGNLTLDNVDFYNNYSFSGGAIYIYNSKGNLNLTDVIFDSNTASYGGALYNNGGTVTIDDNVSFINNRASSSQGGGAIYNRGELYISSNVIFSGNRATFNGSNGGAIYNAGWGNIEIGDGVVFSANSSSSINVTSEYDNR